MLLRPRAVNFSAHLLGVNFIHRKGHASHQDGAFGVCLGVQAKFYYLVASRADYYIFSAHAKFSPKRLF